MSERLSQKEIKQDIREDEVLHYINEILLWVVNHKQQLMAAGVAFVLAILGFVGFRQLQDRKQDAASLALGQALDTFNAPIVGDGADPEDADDPTFADLASRDLRAKELFEQVRADYSRTGAALAATVHLGRLELEAGNPEGARQLWQEFLDKTDDHMLAASVKVSLLALDRDAGQGEEVVAELERELASKRPLLPQDVALYQLAITLEELDRTEEAADAYRRLGDEHPDSPYAQQAQLKAAELQQAAVS